LSREKKKVVDAEAAEKAGRKIFQGKLDLSKVHCPEKTNFTKKT